MPRLIVVALVIAALTGCGNSGSTDDNSLSPEQLNNTTWESSQCEIAYGGYTKHSITFDSNELVYVYKYYYAGCNELLGNQFVESRPVKFGGEVVTESGLTATKIIVTTQFLPTDELGDHKFDVIDYVYLNNGSLYFASKDESNCKQAIDVTGTTMKILSACLEWGAKLDFDQVYSKKI